LVAALGEGGELSGRGGAFGEDGHGGTGDTESGEFRADEGGDKTEVGEDVGVETVRGEAVGVGVEDLKELVEQRESAQDGNSRKRERERERKRT
jgi:hypothetical protein